MCGWMAGWLGGWVGQLVEYDRGCWDQGAGCGMVSGWGGLMGGCVGVWVDGMGGCMGGWAIGSHTSLDQPCLGTDMTGQGELNTPPPPIQPLQTHFCHFSACTGWYIKGREYMPLK